MGSCVLLALMMLTEVVSRAQWGVAMPKVVSAVVGSCAEIRCTIVDPVYGSIAAVTWLKREPGPGNRGFSIIYDSNDPFRQHYSYRGRAEFKGNTAKKQCSLLIKDIRKSDEGTYQLNMEITWGRYWNRRRTQRSQVSGSVLVLIETLRISGYADLIDGQTARLTCSIRHSCPNGDMQLKWINYNVSLPRPWDTQEGTAIINERSGSRTVSSVLTFTPSYAHHGNILGCIIIIDGIPTPSQQNLTLQIKYGLEIPTVNSSIVAVEGSSLLLYCTAWWKPQFSLRWVRNGEAISNSSTGELKQIFDNISSKDAGVYWCVAENALYTANQSTQVSIHYKATILSGPTCTSSANWINCNCRIRANPPGNITWGLNGRILTGNRSDVAIISWVVKSHQLDSSLRLTHPTGTGNLISCVAANELGDSVSNYQLHSKGIFSRTTVLIIGGGTIGLVILIVVAVTLKIQRQKHGEAARVSEAHDDLVIYSTVQNALNAERNDQYSEAGPAAALLTKPAQSGEIVYATVNVSNFRKHEKYIQNEETCEYAAVKHN